MRQDDGRGAEETGRAADRAREGEHNTEPGGMGTSVFPMMMKVLMKRLIHISYLQIIQNNPWLCCNNDGLFAILCSVWFYQEGGELSTCETTEGERVVCKLRE